MSDKSATPDFTPDQWSHVRALVEETLGNVKRWLDENREREQFIESLRRDDLQGVFPFTASESDLLISWLKRAGWTPEAEKIAACREKFRVEWKRSIKDEGPYRAQWLLVRFPVEEIQKVLERLLPSLQADNTGHSDDFTSVNWYGAHYTFAKGNPSEAVAVLWEAYEAGHSIHEKTIGAKIGSSTDDKFRLSKVFRKPKPEGGYEQHSAWGTMIQRGEERGCYRLAPPEPQ